MLTELVGLWGNIKNELRDKKRALRGGAAVGLMLLGLGAVACSPMTSAVEATPTAGPNTPTASLTPLPAARETSPAATQAAEANATSRIRFNRELATRQANDPALIPAMPENCAGAVVKVAFENVSAETGTESYVGNALLVERERGVLPSNGRVAPAESYSILASTFPIDWITDTRDGFKPSIDRFYVSTTKGPRVGDIDSLVELRIKSIDRLKDDRGDPIRIAHIVAESVDDGYLRQTITPIGRDNVRGWMYSAVRVVMKHHTTRVPAPMYTELDLSKTRVFDGYIKAYPANGSGSAAGGSYGAPLCAIIPESSKGFAVGMAMGYYAIDGDQIVHDDSFAVSPFPNSIRNQIGR